MLSLYCLLLEMVPGSFFLSQDVEVFSLRAKPNQGVSERDPQLVDFTSSADVTLLSKLISRGWSNVIVGIHDGPDHDISPGLHIMFGYDHCVCVPVSVVLVCSIWYVCLVS